MAEPKNRTAHAPVVGRFAARLRELRRSRGLTQAELARKSKVALSYIGRLEGGLSAPGIDLADRLATALGVGPEELVRAEGERDPLPVLREQARTLCETLVADAGEETLLLLNPLLVKMIESERRGG